MSNTTLNYLYATRPLCSMAFSGATTTSSISLSGPGGQSGDGFPILREGVLTGFGVWDGTTWRHDSADVSLTAGDRLSVYCQSTGSDFTVKVRVNGSTSTVEIPNVPYNSALYAVIEFTQKRD